ncbi:TPA: hypothetical protein N0F65_004436 [Lagenidium giganteum]|uniref:Ras-GAP domain-containing protein n=1 Tax=Lagenidium giganteum TaxID=4803 RepID=A0AAV2ZJI4_9STRA|nr:TPA: hypothetical protein N0F65_004436 [Lagenidium giganteum]
MAVITQLDERQRSQSDIPRLHEFESAVRMEILSANGQEEMFLRSSSGLSALLKDLGHQHGRAYFRYVLREVFGDMSLIYDGTATPDQILAFAKSIFRRMAKAIHFAPLLLRACSHFVLTEFKKAFPESTQETEIVVGGLLFLRIICPALVKPEMFGFKPHNARSLSTGVQIAKILQHTLRGTPLNDSYPEFVKANEFIGTYKPFVITFLGRFPHIGSAAAYAATADSNSKAITTRGQRQARENRGNTLHNPSWELGSSSTTSEWEVTAPQKLRGMSWTADEMVNKPKRKFSVKFWNRSGASSIATWSGTTPSPGVCSRFCCRQRSIAYYPAQLRQAMIDSPFAASERAFLQQVPRQRITTYDGNTWEYYDSGKHSKKNHGLPPLVCLPDTTGTARCFHLQMTELAAKGYRVIAVQHPVAWSHEEWIHSFDRFLNAMNIQEIHVYGVGLGAYLAQRYSAMYPNRIVSMIMTQAFADTSSFAENAPYPKMLSMLPEFYLKKYILERFPKGPQRSTDLVEAIDYMVDQLETMSQKELASRMTLNCLSCDPNSWKVAISDDKITFIDTYGETTLPRSVREQMLERHPKAKQVGNRMAMLKGAADFPFLSHHEEVSMHLHVHLRAHGAFIA